MDSSSDIQVVEEMASTEYTPVKTIETEVQGVSYQTMISKKCCKYSPLYIHAIPAYKQLCKSETSHLL